MKNGAVLAARHGTYDNHDNLHEVGKAEMRRLAETAAIVAKKHGLEISLLCSTAPRAEQGGQIIAEMLKIPKERVGFHRCFWEDNSHPGDFKEAKKLLEQFMGDNKLVVVVSHLDFVPRVATYVCDKLEIEWRGCRLDYGQGVLVSANGVRRVP